MTQGLDGRPINEDAQVYFYAGAQGLSFADTAEMNLDLDIDADTAYAAWKKGAELRRNSKWRFFGYASK